MILVLFFLLLAIVCLFLTAAFKINIEKIYISSLDNKFKLDIVIKFQIYVLNKIKIFSKKINNKKSKKLKKHKKNIIKEIFNKSYKIERLYLKGFIGCKDAYLTGIITGFLNAIIPNIVKERLDSTKYYYYKIIPKYTNQNTIELKGNLIISTGIKEIFFSIFSKK